MSAEPVIDENLYSRQIYVLGVDAMKKLATSSVLISGLGGLGVEIAKNIILAGVNNVTIHDTRSCRLSDLASNFYLNESHIGKNRALSCLKSLSSLNEYVTVTAKSDELTNDFLSQYNCVIITDFHKESEIKRISTFCHEKGIKLILTGVCGVFAYLFNDFGKDFVVHDNNGEIPSRFLISFITNDERGLVTIAEGETYDIGEGDTIRFEEVEGMTELNGKEYQINVQDKRHFYIGDTSKFGKYTSQHRSGYGIQVIVPKVMNFLEYTEALKNPGRTMDTTFDFCTFGRDQQVILAFAAYQRCLDQNPQNDNEIDGKVDQSDIIKYAKEINDECHIVDTIDEALLNEFARESSHSISPTCAAFGGIAGQEVLKAISGKFTPTDQFLAMGYVESLSSRPEDLEYTPMNDRYDPYRAVFGNKAQDIMMGLRYFIIGAGALGCEQLKNWALMGVATKGEGKVFMTDMDSIERSNLNRQFLFRNSDIGKMKSEAAANAARAMNPSFNIEAHQNRIGPESAHIYNDDFYFSLDGVCNALDNVQTRKFSDQMCVFYKKPLLESGTLGPKAHYQTIVPYLTESYSSQQDPPEKGIPMCTLHNFPSNIDHCCMWARDSFDGLFEKQPLSVNSLLKKGHDRNEIRQCIDDLRKTDRGAWEQAKEAVLKFLKTEKCETFDDCIKWARLLFEELFNFKIRDLQHFFPRDKVSEEGLPFWTGNKRFPEIQTYDQSNQYHAEFVTAAAILRARIFGIPAESNIPQRAAEVSVPEWKPSNKEIKLPEDENNNNNQAETVSTEDNEDSINEIVSLLENSKELHPETFEKDDDTNGHIDFIAAAANIRALNYQIGTEDKLEIKRIAGKIIPAIATTTAMICGLVALEMYKLHCPEKKPIESFRFGSINIAISSFNISEPVPCPKITCPANGIEYTLWDTWEIKGDLTLEEVIDAVKDKYKLIADSIMIGTYAFYMSYSPNEKRMKTKITESLVQPPFNYPPFRKGQYLIQMEILCTDLDGNDVEEVPSFVLNFKQ